MNKPGADYRKILKQALAALPPDSNVGADIASFLKRAPSVGEHFRCSADFLRYRAWQELVRLKDLLLEVDPPPVPPQVCYATPYAVDLSQKSRTIEIYGFDLDRVPLEMVLLGRDGFEDVSSALMRKTHYHATVDLGGIKFASNREVLGLTWGHLVHFAIPLIHPETPLCDSRIEDIPAGKTISYGPSRISGHGPVGGSGSQMWGDITMQYDSNKVDATVCVGATQASGPAFSGCGSEYVYTSEPERVIEWVFGELQSEVSLADSEGRGVVKAGAAGESVARWSFVGFGERSPAGTEPQLTVELRKLRAVSSASENCVSAIAYAESKRMNQLSRDTVARLDPQLGTIPRDIRQLRPHFAPSLR